MIPINNLYYMLVYAWDVLDQSHLVDVGISQIDVPTDLFAKILKNGVDHLIKRGLDRDYSTETTAISGIRGRLEISASVKANTFVNAQVVCTYDELTYNVLHNQIIKAMLTQLIKVNGIDIELRKDLHELLEKFSSVDDVRLTNQSFRQVQLHSNNSFYRLLINICNILHRQLLPDSSGNALRFVDFTEEQLETLFETFLRNFYRKEQNKYTVKKEKFHWQNVTGDTISTEFIPMMETDASLISSEKTLVVEAKFYKKALDSHHYSDRSTIRSTHLFQLFAYLQNLQERNNEPTDGLLIYPMVDDDILIDYQCFDHNIRVATVDLAMPPHQIRERLLSLVDINI